MSDQLIKKLLVVDDDEMILGLFCALLQKTTFQVFTARNGEEGLAVYEQHKPDAVFTDIVMPHMGGIEFLRRLREKDTQLPAVMMTGFSTEETATHAYQLGVSDYLLKPFNMERIFAILGHLEKLAWMRQESAVEEKPDDIHTESIEVSLTNDLPAAHKTVARILKMMGIDDGDLMVGLLEVVINAIEHGNLEITYENKTDLSEIHAYRKLLRERAAQEPYKDRRVTLSFIRKGTSIECVVTDEGRGFDWARALNPNFDANLLHHGRGMLLVQALFDLVEYNDRGNCVRLVKENVRFVEPAG